MDLTEAIKSAQVCLNRAWPRFQELPWAEFGTLKAYEDDGVTQKYQTGLLLAFNQGSLLLKHPFGASSPGRIEEMTAVAVRKFELARLSTQGHSAELRNPLQGDWAGSIKVPASDSYLALTGLPEVADHTALALAMRRARLLSQLQFDQLVDPKRTLGLEAALARVEISLLVYKRLISTLSARL